MIHAGANLIDGVPVEVIRKRLPAWKLLRRRLNKREFEPKLPAPPKPVRLIQSDFIATLFG